MAFGTIRLHLRFSAAILSHGLLITLVQAMVWSLESDWVVTSITCIPRDQETSGGGREARGAPSKMVAPAPLCFLCSSLFRWDPRLPQNPATVRGGARRLLVLGICRGRGSSHFPAYLGPRWEWKESRLVGLVGLFSPRTAHYYLECFPNVYQWCRCVFSEMSYT